MTKQPDSGSSRRRRKVDRLDMKILGALAEQSRQTITELAKNVGLSASPCTARLERLEGEKLIAGYYALKSSPISACIT